MCLGPGRGPFAAGEGAAAVAGGQRAALSPGSRSVRSGRRRGCRRRRRTRPAPRWLRRPGAAASRPGWSGRARGRPSPFERAVAGGGRQLGDRGRGQDGDRRPAGRGQGAGAQHPRQRLTSASWRRCPAVRVSGCPSVDWGAASASNTVSSSAIASAVNSPARRAGAVRAFEQSESPVPLRRLLARCRAVGIQTGQQVLGRCGATAAGSRTGRRRPAPAPRPARLRPAPSSGSRSTVLSSTSVCAAEISPASAAFAATGSNGSSSSPVSARRGPRSTDRATRCRASRASIRSIVTNASANPGRPTAAAANSR